MNDSPFDSLISAFYDGELNDADRQAVEHRLADDADARRELADYGQLSDLLQELDREPLPEEFTAQVLQRLERRTLLAQPATPRHPRVWAWSALVPLLATAAVLLLMWAAPRSNDDRLLVENPDNDSRSTSRDVDVVMFESGGALGGLGAQSSQRLLKRPPSEVPGALPAPSGPVADARMSDEPAAQTASGRRNLAMMTEFGFSAKVKVQDFEVGSVIQAIETSPSGVAVVQLWVVDRQEGLDKLQLLLARNDVSEDEFGVTTKLAAVTDKSARRSKSEDDEKVLERLEGKPANAKRNESLQQLPGLSTSDGLVAIYVEAPREKLAEVLKGLQSERAFVEVNAQPTNAETTLFAALDDSYARESAPAKPQEPARPEEPAPQALAKPKASANGRGEDRKELLGRKQALAEQQVAATDSFRKSQSGVQTGGDAQAGQKPASRAKSSEQRQAGALGGFGGRMKADGRGDTSARPRYMVIDNAELLREVTAPNAEASELSLNVNGQVESFNRGGELSAKKRSVDLKQSVDERGLVEEAKAVAAPTAPLHVIFLVEQASPHK